MQQMRAEEQVRKLEAQLKDAFKGQLDSFAVVKENMEMTERLRDLDKKVALYAERLKEYEEIIQRLNEEADKRDAGIKTLRNENDSLRRDIAALEE